MNETAELKWLCQWYETHCDGDWEHQFGVKIGSIDNPGWSLEIDLEDTELESVEFSGFETDEADSWMRCWKNTSPAAFFAVGSPDALPRMIKAFQTWTIEASTK